MSNQGLETEAIKVQAIQDWPTPFKVIYNVRAFLGLSGYYRRFIKNYAQIVALLTELLQIDSDRKWKEEHTKAVSGIKHTLSNAPVLALLDYSKQFQVYTVASSYAIGAQLTQQFDQGERPIAFISRKLHGAELRHSTYDKGMLAILFAIQKWQVYLAEKEFIIYTDHKPLQYLITQKILNARQQRWLVQLNNYKFIINVMLLPYTRG